MRISDRYIWQELDWPEFRWDPGSVAKSLVEAGRQQGRLLGNMDSLSSDLRERTSLNTNTETVLNTSRIEGEFLDRTQVRSSIARRLGINAGQLVRSSREIDGIVDITLDAAHNYNEPLTKQRLFKWHSMLFPPSDLRLKDISVGQWRDGRKGPMQIVSGPVSREKVHYVAPEADRLDREMSKFLDWFNGDNAEDPVLKAGMAHLWFVTIHPFEDGNGRIARAVADMCIARADGAAQRFYSMSEQIFAERSDYCRMLETTQKGSTEISGWLQWFIGCYLRSIESAQKALREALHKASFLSGIAHLQLNERQRKVVGRLLGPFKSKLTTKKWTALGKCSHDTALRDIQQLISYGILEQNPGGGRSTSYRLSDRK